MRQALWLCSLLVILSSFVSAKDKAIPAVIVNARYVLVTTYSGDDQTNARMMPDDRKAASDVQTALSKWGRYVVVYQPQDADIIIRIRKGRVAEALVGGKVHIGTDQPTSAGPTGTGDINTTNEDMLEVYDSHLGTDTSPLWRAFRTGGLNPPEMTLLQQLRKEWMPRPRSHSPLTPPVTRVTLWFQAIVAHSRQDGDMENPCCG